MTTKKTSIRLTPRQKAKAQAIQDILDKLYPETPIPLDHRDAFTLLVAVLLSAQCTDKRVNLVTPGLFSRANNPYDMAEVPVDDIREIIKPCGLSPAKSKAISNLSKIIIAKHGGQVPESFEAIWKPYPALVTKRRLW
jgi:endonuclease-3